MIFTPGRLSNSSASASKSRRQQLAALAKSSKGTWVALLVITLAACGDDVMGPPQTVEVSSMARLHWICSLFGMRSNGEGGCDPLYDIEGIGVIVEGGGFDGDDWCDGSIAFWDPWCDDFLVGFDPFGGGGGGGSSGGGTGEFEDLITQEEWEEICEPEETGCDPRFQEDWSQSDRAGIELAIQTILDHGCDDLGGLLATLHTEDKIAIWSARVTRFEVLTGSSDAEAGIVRVWDGSTAETGDPPINWAKSLAHEASHLVNTQYTVDSQHTAAAAECF